MSGSFTDALARGVLLCDGAMGTLAQASGFRAEIPGAELAVVAPELVAAMHQRYLAAGADVIETHTFGATRPRLARFGLQGRVRELNAAGAGVAVAAARGAGRPVFVAGSMSPATPARRGAAPDPPAVRSAVVEQAEALVEGGVDLLVLETFGHAGELADAVRAVREVTDLPVVAQATFVDEDGEPVTAGGESPADVLARLADLDLAAVGSNCTLGPQGLLGVVRRMAGDAAVPLAAQPNAGIPHVVAGRSVRYAADAEHFGRYAARYVAAGARLVGGCCGTTPEHTAAAAAAIAAATGEPPPDDPDRGGVDPVRAAPLPRGTSGAIDAGEVGIAPVGAGAVGVGEPVAGGVASRRAGAGAAGGRPGDGEVADDGEGPSAAAGRGAVERWLRARPGARGFLLAAEVGGPGTATPSRHVARARAAAGRGAEMLWVSRPRDHRVHTHPAGLAVAFHDRVDVDAALSVTSWDTSTMALQADLLGLHALGVRTVVCETGNPPVDAEAPALDGTWEVDAVGLLRLAAGLNRGVDGDGQELPSATEFRLGTRVTPGASDLDREARRARAKVDAGAEFLITRPVYELEGLRTVLDALGRDRSVPVLLSVAPLHDFAHAEYLRHEMPDIVVPTAVLDRMRSAADPARTGMALAEDLVAEAAGLVDGVVVRLGGPAAPTAAGGGPTADRDVLAALPRLRAAGALRTRR